MLLALFAVTVLTVCAHFSAYTYLEPFARRVAGASNNEVTSLLVLFGAAGLPAAIVFSRFYGNRPRRFLVLTVSVLTACLILLRPSAYHIGTLWTLLVFWGIAIICFGLAMQAQLLRLAPDAADLAISMFSGLYNVGIGAGALLGKTIAHDFGLGWAGMCGALVATSSLVVCGVTFAITRNSSRRNAVVLAD